MVAQSILDDYTLAELDAAASRLSTTWREWLDATFPDHITADYAPYQAEFWDWLWSLEPSERAHPFVAIWPRGWGKSTSAELACALVACTKRRRYALYICETQEQADDHVANVAAMLESDVVAVAYPETAERHVGKHGNPRGWRRNRLVAASGFTLDAIGLDTASRGVKMDEDRPDLLILDDLDGKLDTPLATDRKLTVLTHSLLPAGAPHAAVLAVQNLVIPDGIFARLADGRADFLADRIVSGPHPALHGLATERSEGRDIIVSGSPSWAAMGVEACQAIIDTEGITAFRAERQHEVEAPSGGLFDHIDYQRCGWDALPELVRVVAWVDPAVTDTDSSDACGIQIDGIDADKTVYRLWSWEQRSSPEAVLRLAIRKAIELGATTVGVETDQGGDTWYTVYKAAAKAIGIDRPPRFEQAKAGAGHGPKAERASRMLADYERGRIVHVTGTHETLERALRRFPRSKPFDLVDAAYWSWHDLRRPAPRKPSVR
jgi:hypothetical protein